MNFHNDYDYEAAQDRWLAWKQAEELRAMLQGEPSRFGENDPPEEESATEEEEADA